MGTLVQGSYQEVSFEVCNVLEVAQIFLVQSGFGKDTFQLLIIFLLNPFESQKMNLRQRGNTSQAWKTKLCF